MGILGKPEDNPVVGTDGDIKMQTEGLNGREGSGDACIKKGNEESGTIRGERDEDRGKEGMGGPAGRAGQAADSDLAVQDFPIFIRHKMSGVRAIEGKDPGRGMAGRAGRSQGREVL